MDDYHALLRRHHLRNTTPRRTVFAVLLNADKPQAISDLVRTCPEIDRTTIYRTLETFTNINVVQIVPIGWKQRYELTSPFRAHHHHLQCTQCHQVIDITSAPVEAFIRTIAAQHDFAVEHHTFEITGTCAQCQRERYTSNAASSSPS